MPLDRFSAPARAWFESSFAAPTAAQEQGWPAIADGDHTLILAPTGSGKTLAAFLWAIDRLSTEPPPDRAERCRVLYVSPLRALAVDIEKNLRAPITGMRLAAERLGTPFHEPTVALRTGDTAGRERQSMLRNPPDILVTTPESLYLMLTSRARETLRSVRWVIVDEIHALAPTKRGAHLALSLERLEAVTERPPQRIGLSATQRPLDEVARFLGGYSAYGPRPVTVVDAGHRNEIELEVVVPVDDLGAVGAGVVEPPEAAASGSGEGRTSIWPHVHPRVLELVLAHRTTIVFVNARRLAERLATRLNELAGDELVRAHHGSLSREQRLAVEDDLKAGRLRALVATSSLELGVDMGSVDLVVLVESPGSVARGIQRIGRAGHHVGEPSVGKLFPKFRGDLLEATAIAPRIRQGLVEEMRYPRRPLDVLAQQIVAAVAVDEWAVDDLLALVRRAANFADLSEEAFTATLDLLAGRYPSDRFSNLRPRVVWDRVEGRLQARQGAQRLAVTSGGTIPDRGLFGVFLPDGVRVGELDEEMVYESRPGDVIALGATAWRIDEITPQRVVVTPAAPGQPAKAPFWKGDRPGRPLELGRAVGRTVRELRALPADDARARLAHEHGLDERATENLLRYLDDQAEATGAVPDDRTIVVERCPDEIGDWRVCLLTPFGARVHAPWALAIEERLSRQGMTVPALWSDDGIVLRLPEAVDDVPLDDLVPSPDEIDELVVARLPATSLFASRFRENAARALLLPRRRPGERTPLWQQRQRAADLLDVASSFPSFPMLVETTRECLRDVFDVPALREVLSDVRARTVRVVPVETRRASPFAQSLLFGWIAVYMYEGDAPVAERRAAALALDRDLLRDLLGAEELRELLDPAALATVELELQHLTPGRAARHADALHDLLRDLGDLTVAEIVARCADDPAAWITQLVESRRAIPVPVAGEERLAAVEDAGRLRDALGVALPAGIPAAFTESVEHPLDELVARYARTHGPFTVEEVAGRLGATAERVSAALARLADADRVLHGEFRPDGLEREWCDPGVLQVVRRRSLAALRREVEPVDAACFGRFLPAWHGIGAARRGTDALVEAVEQLQGAAIPASVLERDVLPARVDGYRPAMLDELCATGALVWVGAGALGPDDGRVRLCFRDRLPLLVPSPPPGTDVPSGPIHDAIRERLRTAGASFWPDLLAAAGTLDERALLDALWDLVWAGEVTNDTPAPLRVPRRSRRAPARPRPGRLTRLGPPSAAGRWSLVGALHTPSVNATEIAHATAMQLLARHGVVTREGVRAEGLPGGFAAVYPVLRALEDGGRARRGWFVAGLGAAQFALPGAVERLRAHRDVAAGAAGVLVLAATDPAQPYGATLPWPERAGRVTRSAGAYVVMVGGRPAAFVERNGRSLVTFPLDATGPEAWIEGLVEAHKSGRLPTLQLERIDDTPARTSPLADALRAAGFADGYRGLTLRA